MPLRDLAARAALRAVVAQFADAEEAETFVLQLRWPEGVTCPRYDCRSQLVARLHRRGKWRCRTCGRQFSVKVDTIFEDSSIGFDKWVPAMWVLAEERNAVSSSELARARSA